MGAPQDGAKAALAGTYDKLMHLDGSNDDLYSKQKKKCNQI